MSTHFYALIGVLDVINADVIINHGKITHLVEIQTKSADNEKP
jgi:hypothetical protein